LLKIYFQVVRSIQPSILPSGYEFVYAKEASDIPPLLSLWKWKAPKYALKVLTGKRVFFGVTYYGHSVMSGWANIGFCKDFLIGSHDVVIGPVCTNPAYRGLGLAPAAIRRIINMLFNEGFFRFWIAADARNVSSLRMIRKAGFDSHTNRL